MFNLLDKIYQDTNDDCLGSLLGGFNPYIFADSMSADPAAWGDWKTSVKKITSEQSLTPNEAFQATKTFVNFHQDEFGFDLSWLIDKLNTMSSNGDEWKTSIRQALKQS